MTLFTRKLFARALCLLLLATLPLLARDDGDHDRDDGIAGAVYSMTNAAAGNGVAVFDRMADGTLSYRNTVATGGLGSGAPLASQSSLAMTDDGRFLLASNAGSDTVSVLSLHGHNVALASQVASGGHFPYSVAVHNRLVYVLNAGVSGGANSSVSGFRLDHHGNLSPIPNSTTALSAPFVDPAQVGFDADGDHLVVTERGTNTIDVFPVHRNGTLGTIVTNASAGAWPYGFAFGHRNELFVTEAQAMAANASTVSSYIVHGDGTLTTVSGATATHQTAACWIVVPENGKYTYASNALSKSISGFSIDHDGAISLLNSNGVTGLSSIGFTVDDALSDGGHYLYVLSILGSGITAFRVNSDGSLTGVQSLPWSGLTAGLVAR